ncbi:hypothetical protein Tco_1046709 [Tanacetum coccineum]
MPSFPSPEPKVSYFDDLDFFKDFENEFPAIVYNDALTYKSDFLTEPTLKSQHIDEFDLKDETSLSEYDEVEQNVLYFNDLKSGKDDDDNEIDIIQSSGDMPEDSRVPIILGRQFLATARAMIDVFNKKDNACKGNQYGVSNLLIRRIQLHRKQALKPNKVSPIDMILKKGGMNVVLNDNNELIPSRTVIGWRDSSKFRSHPKIKKRQHSLVLMGLLLTLNAIWIMQRTNYFSKMHDGNFSRHGGRLYGSIHGQLLDIRAIQHMSPLPPRDQRHLWLSYQVKGYTKEIVHDFEQRLEMIFGRQVNQVHILDFEGLTPDMRQDLAERLRMVYTGKDGQEIFMRLVASTLCFQLGGARRSMTWRQFILTLGLHTTNEMAEEGFAAYWLGSERVIFDKGDLSGYWIEISLDMDFLRAAPSYTYIRDRLRRLCHRHAEGRKSDAKLSGGHFIGCLAHHFGLVSDDRLRGLSVVTRELPLIDMGKLRLGRLEEEIHGLRQDVGSMRGLVERLMTDQGRFSTWMIRSMTQLMEASGRTYQAFNGTFKGSYPEDLAAKKLTKLEKYLQSRNLEVLES